MTHDEMIAVIQAAKEGRAVEYRIRTVSGRDPWQIATTPCWDFLRFEYRVRPQPRELWITEEGAIFSYPPTGMHCRVTHFREVI